MKKIKTKYERKQRCPLCGDWLTPYEIYKWEQESKGKNPFSFMYFPKTEDLTTGLYVCKSCHYTTSILGSDNRRIQEVLQDIIKDNLTAKEWRYFKEYSNDATVLKALYEQLRLSLAAKNDMNALAALLFGILPNTIRENLIMETRHMKEASEIFEHIEARILNLEEYNYGDLAVALCL